MPFDFDELNPIDTFLIPAYPNNERNHRAAVKDMLEIEHDTAEGRHKFGIGDDTARDAITTWVVGSTWYSTQGGIDVFQQVVISVGPVVWHNVDARGGGLDSDLDDVAHINEQSLYTVTQWSDFITITPSAGGPGDLVAVDCDLSPAQFVTIVDDTEISNPINILGTANSTTIMLELLMNGTPGHLVTFASNYRSPGGLAPSIDTAANARTLLFITQTRDAKFMVTSSPGLATF